MKAIRKKLLSNQRYAQRQRGLTLIEILVALFVSGLVLAGVVQIYASSKQAYRVQESLSRLQENGRFAINRITHDLRMAGYSGCLSKFTSDPNRSEKHFLSVLNNPESFLFNLAWPVSGFHYSGGWVPGIDTNQLLDNRTLSSVDPQPVVPESPHDAMDILTIRTIERTDAVVDANMVGSPKGFGDLQLQAGHGIQARDVLIISDCNASDLINSVFQVSAADETSIAHCDGGAGCTAPGGILPGNRISRLATNYTTGAEIYRVSVRTYYVAQAPGKETSSLFVLTNSQPLDADNPYELIDGVENMHVYFGVKNASGDEYRYLRAAELNGNPNFDWNNVVSVRVHLLLQTEEDNLATEKITYFYDGVSDNAANDWRLYRAFTTTVALRNRDMEDLE